MWIDSHCHLDAAEFDADRDDVRQAARTAGVAWCVIPAVQRSNFEAVRLLAHRHSDMYALGIHPLYVSSACDDDLVFLDQQLTKYKNDPHLVAVGEIGLDYFVPSLCTPTMRLRQWQLYLAQIKLAKKHHLPVILHVRRSADMLLKGLQQVNWPVGLGGIAHAFNGSFQQAQRLIDYGFKLGFGGTLTFERAQQIRRLAIELPMDSIVLETDAPDMAPAWLYQTAEERAVQRAGQQRHGLISAITQKNSPTELPRIGDILSKLRACQVTDIANQSTRNVITLMSHRFPFDEPTLATLNKNQSF